MLLPGGKVKAELIKKLNEVSRYYHILLGNTTNEEDQSDFIAVIVSIEEVIEEES
jgi:hypothetical protein